MMQEIEVMSIDWRNFAVIFALGILLISVATAIPLYAQSVISQLQSNLDGGQLSQQGTWDQQGSLRWWKLSFMLTYQPISSVLNTAGLLTIILSVLYGVFALAYGVTCRKVADKKKTASPSSWERNPISCSNSYDACRIRNQTSG